VSGTERREIHGESRVVAGPGEHDGVTRARGARELAASEVRSIGGSKDGGRRTDLVGGDAVTA
jgi:hypothetical protein